MQRFIFCYSLLLCNLFLSRGIMGCALGRYQMKYYCSYLWNLVSKYCVFGIRRGWSAFISWHERTSWCVCIPTAWDRIWKICTIYHHDVWVHFKWVEFCCKIWWDICPLFYFLKDHTENRFVISALDFKHKLYVSERVCNVCAGQSYGFLP